MKVLVWGLGYVGTVSAACFAELGHDVIGVEINPVKVRAVNEGKTAITEPGLKELINRMVGAGKLKATGEGSTSIKWADVSLICVGTPSGSDGDTNLEHVRKVAIEIGRGLKWSSNFHVIVMRSTVFPGTVRSELLKIIESESGLTAGKDFGLVMNPEFLREASAIRDFYNPPYTIIGEMEPRSGEIIHSLYQGIDAPIHHTTLEEAEILKLVNNAFHALKIGFANEVGRICDQIHIDSHKVMDLVCEDKKLNISTVYLKPGFAFGGSCLPKDLRSLSYNSRRLGLSLPILEAELASNQAQVEYTRKKIHDLGANRIGILGLSFKPNSDDLRESPVISLIRDLWQDGMDVLVHDPDVQPEIMLGSNREYLERQLPQINKILKTNIQDVLSECQLLVVTQKRPEFVEAVQKKPDHLMVLDLVRINPGPSIEGANNYYGIAW